MALKFLTIAMCSVISVAGQPEISSQNSPIESKLMAAAGAGKEGQQDIFDATKQANQEQDPHDPTVMSPNALQLAKLLKIDSLIEELKSKNTQSLRKEDMIEVMYIRQQLMRQIQYAGLELEEALGNIDGDLAQTNMQYSLNSAKHDRSVLMNNVATFVASGGLGVLDSAYSINHGPPVSNIFGITGNAAAVAIPLWGLRPRKYDNPHAGHHDGNMLAPIFGKQYSGAGYDPIIWKYLETVPAQSKEKISRRQLLLKTWQNYRGLSDKDGKSKDLIDKLISLSDKDKKVTLDLLKTRSELLVELRAVVQGMYKDISDLNTYLLPL